MANHPNIPKHNPNANVHSTDEFMSMNNDIEVLIVVFCVCNDERCTSLDLSSYVSLKVFEVGELCFEYVKEVKMIGLKWLESVVIGENCFTKKENEMIKSPTRHLYLKDCERLRELRIGDHSFEKYSSWVIVNLPSLEETEVGEWLKKNGNRSECALIVKSKRLIMRMTTRPAQLEIVVVR